ncbi:MAG: MMPL family transporter [Chloroflexota bacterium]
MARVPVTRPPWTVRVAGFSAAHRWPVFGLWFVFTLGLFVASLSLGGTNTAEAVSNQQQSRFESTEANNVFSPPGTETGPPSSQYLLVIANPSGTIDDAAFGAAIDDAVARMTALHVTVDGVDGPVFEGLVDPRKAPPGAALVSADRTAVRLIARVPGDGDALKSRLAPVTPMTDALRRAHSAIEFHALNGTIANDQIQKLVSSDLDRSLVLTIPLTFAILLIAFGTVVAAVVPLILAVTSLLAAFGLLGIYSRLVDPVSPYATQLVVLIGLAVAVDYSLFMITRFRTERRHGRGKLAAIHVSSSTAGRAVFFSGLAVTISIAGLFTLDDPLFRSMAIGTIAVVVIAVVGSLTFLPATLAILGDGVNRLRVPFVARDAEEGSGPWGRMVRGVMRRPIVYALVASVALLAAATPVLRLHIGQTDFSSFPDTIDSVVAIRYLDEKWPQGTTLDLDVVVTRADEAPTKAAIATMSTRILALPGLSGPPTTTMSRSGTVAYVAFSMSGGRNDIRNRDSVDAVRKTIVPEVFGSLPGVRALVTGDAAYSLDVANFYAGGMPLVMAFVLGLSFLLLLVAFRSIVIPIKAILLNLLSTGAAYGLLVLVFQEGWLSSQLGFKPGVIEAFVPVFIFTILFGLSMDYHVFILTRIKEARDHGLSSNDAVARGISVTAGTVTSAAAIMVVVFSVFVTLQLVIIRQLGFGLAVAVFLDATVIRSVLLPATMRLLGEWNWWLPGFLGWLPRVTIEGATDDDDSAPEVAEIPARA